MRARHNAGVNRFSLTPRTARLSMGLLTAALFFGTLMPGSWRDNATRPFEDFVNLSAAAHVVLFALLCYLLPMARLWRVQLWHAPALAVALALLTEGLQFLAVDRHPGLNGVAQDLIGAAIGFWLGRARYLEGMRSSPVDSAVPQTMTAPHRSIQPVTASPRNSTP